MHPNNQDARPKHEVLRMWDGSTAQLNSLWEQISPQRFGETLTAFGQYTDVVHNFIKYVIDNEIHHRGQHDCQDALERYAGPELRPLMPC